MSRLGVKRKKGQTMEQQFGAVSDASGAAPAAMRRTP
jgi:hypothetical protein